MAERNSNQRPSHTTITWSLPPPSGVIRKQQSNITSALNDEHEGGRLRRKLEAAEQMSSQTGSCAGHHLPGDRRYARGSLRSYSNVIFYTAIGTYSPTHVRTEHEEHHCVMDRIHTQGNVCVYNTTLQRERVRERVCEREREREKHRENERESSERVK